MIKGLVEDNLFNGFLGKFFGELWGIFKTSD